jgi:ankyrin repeat protein
MIAAALGYIDVVSLLVSHGAGLNSKDKNGNTGN